MTTFDFAEERLTRPEAADYLGTSVEFLETDVVTKRNSIPYIKIGRKVFYMKSDLNQWIVSRRVNEAA